MPANDDGLGPVVDKTGDVVDHDGLPENGSIEIVSNGAVGALPHLLQLELFHSGFIGGDGGTLNSDFAVLDSFGGIKRHFVVSFISKFHSQIEVLDVEVKEGVDELVLDLLPEDSGHLISIEFGNWVFNFDLLCGKRVGEGRLAESVDAP